MECVDFEVFRFNGKIFLGVSHQILMIVTAREWKQEWMNAETPVLWSLQKKGSNPQCSYLRPNEVMRWWLRTSYCCLKVSWMNGQYLPYCLYLYHQGICCN